MERLSGGNWEESGVSRGLFEAEARVVSSPVWSGIRGIAVVVVGVSTCESGW